MCTASLTGRGGCACAIGHACGTQAVSADLGIDMSQETVQDMLMDSICSVMLERRGGPPSGGGGGRRPTLVPVPPDAELAPPAVSRLPVGDRALGARAAEAAGRESWTQQSWACEACTHRNPMANHDWCAVCSAPRHDTKGSLARLAESQAAAGNPSFAQFAVRG